jgi:glycosyltransferase involved in cell wall biosynthesis
MRKNRRILAIAPTPFFSHRGCHVRILGIARALQRAGHEVTLATYAQGEEIPGIPTLRIRSPRRMERLAPGPTLYKPFLDVLLLLRTIGAARKRRPDLLLGFLHEGLAIGRAASRLLGIPLAADLQGSLAGESAEHRFVREGSLPHRWLLRIERNLERNSRGTIFRNPTAPGTGIELEDGVDPRLFRPLCPDPRLRETLGIPPDRRLIVYLGVLSEQQGTSILLRAARLLREDTALHWLVMGYPGVSRWRGEAKDLGIGDRVTFTGAIPYTEVSRYLALGAVAVAPKISRHEGDQKVLCYMSCGLPTVAFDSPVNRRMLGPLGIYPPWPTPEGLAEGIREALELNGAGLRLGVALRARAADRFSWEKAAEPLVEWLDRRTTCA